MSQRKHGAVVVSIPGERSKPVRLDVSWTSRADMNRAAGKVVDTWARSVRQWWGVYVDTTTLDTSEGGKVFINDDHSKFVAQFSVQEKGAATPPPVPAFSITGGRR